MRPRHERLATLDEASSGGKGLRIDVSIHPRRTFRPRQRGGSSWEKLLVVATNGFKLRSVCVQAVIYAYETGLVAPGARD